jgi:hypothetical protein
VTGHRALLATAALLGLPLWGATAAADDGPRGAFRLVWVRGERTESCAGRDAIAQAVTQRLGKNVFGEPATRSIEAVLQHEGDLWEAHIYVREADGRLNGSRILTSRTATCASIEAAATLAIALAIDPESALRPAPPPLPSSASPTAASPVPPPPLAPALVAPCASTEAPPPPPPPPPPRPPLPCPVERPCPPSAASPAPASSRAAVALRAVAAFGLLPAPSPGLALSTELTAVRFVHATAGVLYLPEQPAAGGDFAFGLTAAWLGACARPWDSLRTSLSACVSALAGGMHSVVYGLEPTHPGERAWAGGSLGAVFRVRPVGPLEVEVGADLVIPFTRYQYAVESQATNVFQQGAVAGVGFVGAGMSIP